MSKRKRSGKGPDDPGAVPPGEVQDQDEPAATEDMAHVSPDLLAGSPDIFAKPAEPAAEPDEPAPEEAPTPPEPVNLEATAEPPEAPAVMPPAPAAAIAAPAPVAPPPAQPHRGASNSSVAFGIVLVVVGIFALGVVVFGVDLTQYGWPLFVIIPGVTLLIVGFFGVGQGASIPGGLLTMLGLVLAYQSAYGDWASWAFAWALVAPFGVGLGMYLQALSDRNVGALRQGRTLMFIGLVIFMIGFVFFESILGISGMDYGLFGKAALPLLLIVGGVILLVRNAQRSRKA